MVERNLIEAKPGKELWRLDTLTGNLSRTLSRRDRLRQFLILAGAENLLDHELVEVMLFTNNPRADAESLAEELLDRFGSLAEVLSAEPEALAAAGLSMSAVAGVRLVREMALRFMRAELHSRPLVASRDTLIDYCSAQIAHSKVEEFHILFLDRKNALIKHERQQRGTVDHTPVYTREVVKRALELGASALILVHNHPSGDPTPSKADIAVTKDIVRAAAPLGVTVHDHLIIGRGHHSSLRDLGLI
jgi:DNA repair protein RadC